MTFKNTYKDDEDKLAQEAAAVLAQKPDGFDDSAYRASKPVYTDTYGDRIDELLSGLEHRPDFSYDAESDPLYQQYRSQYRRESERAVDDTLAAAASHAGGMNSYAVTAARQAGDYYNAQLMEILPELTELAYQMYQADYDEDVSRLNRLREQEAEDYSRYQDALSDWYTELEAAYRQYRDSVADSQWQESLDYEKAQDAAAADRWQQEFDYQKAQDAVDNAYRQDAFEYGKEQDAVDNAYREDAFEYGKAQDAVDNAYRQDAFEYGKEQDAVDNAYRQDAFEYGKEQDAVDNAYRQDAFEYGKAQDAVDNAYRQDAFEYGKEQDAIDNAYRQDAFEYGKEQDAIDNAYRQDAFEYGKEQDAIDNAYRQEVFEYEKAQDAAAANPYAGTDYYRDAIEAARRGDREAAEAALEKRAEKMSSPDYKGNGGGTSMAEAYAYVESLLAENATTESAAVEYLQDAGYTDEEVDGLISEAVWDTQRDRYLRTGSGAAEASYDTYEEYVAAYIRYLSEQ